MKTRRAQSWLIFAAIAIAAPILTGCAGGNTALTASWPGLEVIDDTIYLSNARVYAFNPDGTPRWSFPDQQHQLEGNQAFFAPPAADEKVVVVTDYHDAMFGLDPASGTQKWYYKSPKQSRFIGGPVLGEDMVYAATVDGIVHAIDRNPSGEITDEKWSFPTNGSIWSTPLLADGTLYVTSMDKHVYALDAATGKLQWKFPDDKGEPQNPPMGGIVGTPTLHDDVLYFGSFNNQLYALDIKTHKALWSYPTANWVWGSPAVDDESGYVIAADLNGNIFAIDPASGDPKKAVWSYKAKPATGAEFAVVVGSPALRKLGDKTVVYVTSDGNPNLYVLNVADGKEAVPAKSVTYTTKTMFLFWETGGTNPPLPAKLYPPPAFTDSIVLVATHEGAFNLFALDADTLEQKWEPQALKDVDTVLKAKSGTPTDQGQGGLFGRPESLIFMLVIFVVVTFVLRPAQGGKK